MYPKEIVRWALSRPLAFDWTLQGLGMLRTYLDERKTLRLHVWHPLARYEGASTLHTHPWDFEAYVIAGVVENQRYVEAPEDSPVWGDSRTWKRQRIFCGVGGGLEGRPKTVRLFACVPETYSEGDGYWQDASEIHESSPRDGTVTIIRRSFEEDVDHAYVYFEDEWVTAEPRPATDKEVTEIVSYALDRWF